MARFQTFWFLVSGICMGWGFGTKCRLLSWVIIFDITTVETQACMQPCMCTTLLYWDFYSCCVKFAPPVRVESELDYNQALLNESANNSSHDFHTFLLFTQSSLAWAKSELDYKLVHHPRLIRAQLDNITSSSLCTWARLSSARWQPYPWLNLLAKVSSLWFVKWVC
jgi:hypothetical protein